MTLYAFEPFGTVDGVISGAPIKIMPVGVFYRGDRKLTITSHDLKQIADNAKAGLPRFRIPINENHSGVGKVGTVGTVEYIENAAEGPGLYATQYELTDEGKKLVQQKRYDAVSPEVIWTKNDGAKYQDPQTGKWLDNVLVGLALTDKPFFGHDQVALFSATVTDEYKQFDAERRQELAKKGFALPDGSYPIENKRDLKNALSSYGRNPTAKVRAHIMKRAKDLGAEDMIPPDWMAEEQEIDSMADTIDPKPKKHNGYTKLKETMTQKFQEIIALINGEEGEPEPMPMAPQGMMQENQSVSTAVTPADKPQETPMTQPTTPTKPPESFSVTAEEFNALKAKAEEAAKLQEQFTVMKAATDKMAAELQTATRARRRDQLLAHCEHFSAIPVKAEDLADKFLALEEKDPELYKYFDSLLSTVNNQITTAGLFSQVASARVGGNAETFEAHVQKVVTDKFAGDMSKYTQALDVARIERPDLFIAYNETYAPSRK